MTSALVAAVACGNGLGHVKRQTVVLGALLDLVPDLRLRFVCRAWQTERLTGWAPFERLRRAGADLVTHDAGTGWPLDRHELDVAFDREWPVRDADLVYSDNLVAPLAAARRSVLGASFLWHEVHALALPGDAAVTAYAERCEEVIAAAAPMWVASRDFAMPGVIGRPAVQAVGLVPLVAPAQSSGRRVARLAAGASPSASAARRLAEPIVDRLRAAGYETTTSPEDAASVVVGRAGLGTISDAMAQRAPVLWVEDDMPEIAHNQRRLEALGVGAAAGRLGDDVEALLDGLRERTAAIDVDGAAATASIIAGSLAS